jgi:hypothetical protein
MGDCNITCGASGLPIHTGDTVIMAIIAENPFSELGISCYSTHSWYPILLPIRMVYDGYGRFSPCSEEDPITISALEFLKKNALYVPLGENKCHDIEVQPDKLTWKLVNEAIHESRLKIKGISNYKNELLVNFFPVLDGVFDLLAIPDTHHWHEYCRTREGIRAQLETLVCAPIAMDEIRGVPMESYDSREITEKIRGWVSEDGLTCRSIAKQSRELALIGLDATLDAVLLTQGMAEIGLLFRPKHLVSECQDARRIADFHKGVAAIADRVATAFDEDA